jgi:hypothetical protein
MPDDGEAIVTDEAGLAVFDLLRSWRHDADAVLCAFDLIELDGQNLRRLPNAQTNVGQTGRRAEARHCAQRALRRRRR